MPPPFSLFSVFTFFCFIHLNSRVSQRFPPLYVHLYIKRKPGCEKNTPSLQPSYATSDLQDGYPRGICEEAQGDGRRIRKLVGSSLHTLLIAVLTKPLKGLYNCQDRRRKHQRTYRPLRGARPDVGLRRRSYPSSIFKIQQVRHPFAPKTHRHHQYPSREREIPPRHQTSPQSSCQSLDPRRRSRLHDLDLQPSSPIHQEYLQTTTRAHPPLRPRHLLH